jgi:drug/metabolite transporter (DMT)-like permease
MDLKRVIFFFIILVCTEFVALWSAQKYANNTSQKQFMVLTMVLYGIPISLLLYKLLEFRNIAIVNFLWNVFSTMSGFLITLFIFKEHIHNLEWLGAALGLLSIFLIIYGGSVKNKGSLQNKN